MADALLLIYADALDDLEDLRKRQTERLRSLTSEPTVGPKGGTFGKGLAGTPEAERFAGMVDAIAALEHGAELELKRALRQHPLGGWVARTVGVGEKQGARLLAAISDPATRRTVSQLWAYCGYHVLNPDGQTIRDTHAVPAVGVHDLPPAHVSVDTQSLNGGRDSSSDPGHTIRDTQSSSAGVAPSRKRGTQSNWNDTAKMRAFLVAESCMKQRTSPYRLVYDNGRAKYADSTHQHPCPRCGPAGRPALIGSPLSDGHKHARALRLVAKAVLRDLWIEAKELA